MPPGEQPPTIDYPVGTTPPGITPETLAWTPTQSTELLRVTEEEEAPTSLTMTPVSEVMEELPVLKRKEFKN